MGHLRGRRRAPRRRRWLRRRTPSRGASAPPRRKSRRGCEIREDEGESARGGGEIDGQARAHARGRVRLDRVRGDEFSRGARSRRSIAPRDRRGARAALARAPIGAAKPARGSAPSDGSSIVKSATPRTRGGVALETHLAPNILPGSFVEDALRVPPRWLRRERRAPEAVARQRRRFRAKEEMADYKKDHHAVTCRVARRDRRTRDVRLTSRVILGDCGRFS